MEEITEIKAAISRFRLDANFTKQRLRWQKDFDLFRLKPYNAGKGYYSYTSNAPRVVADKVISMLTESKLLIRVPEDLLTDEETKTANNVERLIYGSLHLNDEAILKLPNTAPVRDQMAWYAVVRGGFGVKMYVYKNDKGDTIPDIAVWDIYNMAYGVGEDGLRWAAYTYKISREQAEKEYDIRSGFTADSSGSTKDVDCVEYWNEEKYGLIVADQWAKDLVEHKCDHCPVYIMQVGSTPLVWQTNYDYTQTHVGESIFAPNRELFPSMNKTLSDLVTLVRRGVKVPLGYWSADGTKTIEEDIWQVEKAASVPLQLNEKIEPLFKETMPADATTLLNWESGELQRGGLSHTAFGELGFRLSGFAINQLQQSLATVITPFAQTLERAYLMISLELIQQYSKGSFPPIKVRGRTSRNQAFGYPKALGIKPSDIEGDWHPEIKLEPTLPKDDAQNLQLAQLARDGEIPLLADETIRAEYLGVRDVDLENQKISGQWADNLIVNRLWKAYVATLEDGDTMKAQNVLAELRRVMMMTGQAGAQGRQGGGGAPIAQPGMGLPPGGTGVPASTIPPEMLGGMPPGAQNAQMQMFPEEA